MKALETGGKVPVTKETARAIYVLTKEYWIDELVSEFSALQAASAAELIAALSDRIIKLEHQLSFGPSGIIAELRE
jgi:hypothetical protein